MESPDLICSHDASRGKSELLLRLVFANVTAIAAFCNLLLLRGESLKNVEPVLFCLAPFTILVQAIAGFVIINLAFVCNVIVAPKTFFEEVERYTRRWRVLFCKQAEPESETEESTSSKEAWCLGNHNIDLLKVFGFFRLSPVQSLDFQG